MKKAILVVILMVFFGVLSASCSGFIESPGVDLEAGQELFNQTEIGSIPGCITCHSLEDGVVILGPSLAGWRIKAEKEAQDLGVTALEFTRGSILDPDAFIIQGFPASTMPAYWGEVLTAEQLDNLVTFLLSLE